MTLLERFRTQPRHKHPDPAVRLAYVGEIPLDERDAIGAMAREDEDPQVRRAAVAKLMHPGLLGIIAREDRDESVRLAAVSMLRDIALEAFEGTGEADSLDAVDALVDSKTLGLIAKTAKREIVALRALSRIGEARALGSIARHGASEAARREALERLRERAERAEILAVALNSDFKDTALAALEIASDRSELEQVAARGKNKAAIKRARSIIRDADERAARELRDTAAEGVSGAMPEVAPAESDILSASSGAPQAAAVPVVDAVDEAAERAREAEEALRRREREQELQAERERAEAARTAADEERRREAERRHLRLSEVADQAAAVAADADLTAARRQFALARREWKDLSADVAVAEEPAARFAAAEAALASREADARAADKRARADALARLHHMLGRIEPVLEKPDLSLKTADRALREVRTALASIPPLPSKQDYDDVNHRLKTLHTALVPKVQELREATEWQRWANVTVQEQLCVRMEALRTLEDPEAIARDVHALQQQWREAADVPRAQADALWRRFKAAHDEVWPRCEAHFAAEARARADNLARKLALCERAEALADSTTWIRTAEEIKHLQAEWNSIGPVSRGQERTVWERFRSACDRFFTRRREDLVQRKSAWADNLTRKETLCARAEALAESSDWEQASAEIRRLQAEWKTIGPVKKSRSEAIWQRFRAACDRFFARYGERHRLERAERVSAREAICAELETLVQGGAGGAEAAGAPEAGLADRVRALRARWQREVAGRGVDPDHARALDQRFTAALAATVARWPAVFGGTELDLGSNQKRMEALVKRIEELAALVGSPEAAAAADQALSQTTRLAAMLKEALAANTIGGKVDEEPRLRAALDEVRHAQATWLRFGPVPDDIRRPLADRFHRACRRIAERADARGAAASVSGSRTGSSGKSGVPSRAAASARGDGSGR